MKTMSKIYRVTFTTSLLVEADDERQAEMIGQHSLADEVDNGLSELYAIDHITDESELHPDENYSLPWTDTVPGADARCVNMILKENGEKP